MPAIDSDSTTIFYDIYGEGSPVLLLHGGANDRRVWGPAGYLEPLAEHFQVVTVDLRGAGESATSGDTSDHFMEQNVEDIWVLVDALSVSQVSIWGVSMGGQVALAFAAAHPARVRALVIAGADLEGWSASPDEYVGFADAIETGGMEVVVEGFNDPEDPLPQWMLDSMRRTDPRSFAASMRAHAEWPGIEQRVQDLRMPILFVGGEDEYEAGALEAMAEKVPDGHALRVPEANHIQAFIDASYVVPRAMEFLRSGG